MPKYWFDHVHLISRDPVTTADFYEKNFGTIPMAVFSHPPRLTGRQSR